ncbi:MAG TPA: amino acid adenylation domain-containing protein [Pseudomonadales bacterium]
MTHSELQRFLRDLWRQGVELWLENDQLRFKGSKQLLAGDTLKSLRENKPAIIELLQQQPLAYSGFPLSHGQRAIYLMQSMAPDSAAYNQACLLRLTDDLDTVLLESSLDILLQRHAPLRMSIRQLDGEMAQQVSYSLPSILSQETTPIRSADGWQHWLDNEADQPFDLANEPLIRARLLITDSEPAHYHLLLLVHHIVADFWALHLIIRELESIYLAGLTGRTPDLPEIRKLYKDYVIDEQDWLQSPQGAAARDYWHRQLTPLPATLELPCDYPRPARPQFHGQELSFTLGELLTRQLKAAARQQQVTPFVWVLSCYQLLLHRYTGEQDIAIGSPVACRTQKDYQLLAGHFTNPVVLRAQLDGNTAFDQLLQGNKERVLQAMKHQQYPLQKLIEELQPAHQLGSSPLFQVAISWNQLNDRHQAGGRLIDDVIRMEQRGAVYQLVLTCYDQGDDIRVSWRFNSELHKPESITRLHQHLCNAILASCDNAGQLLGRLRFLSDAEKQLIVAINNTASVYPKHCNLATLFRNSVKRHGQAPAFRDVANRLDYSYRELDDYSDRLAHHLTGCGLVPGQHAVLCISRGYDMLATLLACLKAGIIYVPVDPTHPAERSQAIIDTAGAAALICAGERPPSLQAPLLINIRQLPACDRHEAFAIVNNGAVGEDDVACIFFTSGSTGTPKGVQVPHRAAARLVLNTNYLHVKPGQRFCHFSNVSFDASSIEIWGALLNGATLLCIDNNTLLSPQAFAAFVQQEKPHYAFITTALFNVLVDYQADLFRDFICLMVGGEALDNVFIDACLRAGKPASLLNAYGPTENGSLSTVFDIEQQTGHSAIPIGRVLSNNQAYIEDAYGNPTPIGVIGELILGGDGIATGYIHQSELTAQKFIADHHRGRGLLYRTGDLAWLRDDGMIMYAGRADDLVKIRGFRIELGEIEQALAQHPAIRQCCVVVHRQGDQPLLAAYYVADSAVDPHSLGSFLRRQLPPYMLPAAWLQMDALPLSANGKIDRRHLPPPLISQQQDYVAPRNSQEQWMAAIWQDILGISEIGIYDNFFELGGHSLLAVKLASAIAGQWHVDIGMRTIFEHPDIASLCEAVGNRHQQALPDIIAQQGNERVPAALSQQRLWFLQQLNPDSSAYNMPVALRFSRPLKPARIQQAIHTLLQRHQVLRTRFIDNEGVALMQVDDHNDWALPMLDFSQLAADKAERQAHEQISLLANQPFDLAQGPLLRAVLIKLPQHQSVLAFCLHHIIIDGWSVNLLLQELGALLDEPPRPLLPLTVQYRDFSLWQHSWLHGERLESQLQYWRQQLAGAPALINLPGDRPRPAVLSQHGAQYHFSIDQHTVARLKTLAGQHNASLFMVMLAGYALLMNRYSQQDDICIGFPIAGRQHKALQPLIGLFVNNLVVRSHFDDNLTVAGHIRNVRQATLDAYAHQDVPFDLIIDALKLERSLSYTPLLQVSFALENASLDDSLQAAFGDSVSQQALDWHIAKYDLNLTCYDSQGDMQAVLEYSTDLFDQATVAQMARHFCRLLQQLPARADNFSFELELLDDDERSRFVPDWQKQRELNQRTFISAVNRFEIQAGKYHKKTALQCEDQAISYGRLNASANRLAQHLRQQGIGAGDYVGLYMERSIELVTALLAILKTGAAYIPLDPHSPAERVNFIINDAGIRHVLTRSELAGTITASCITPDTLQDSLATLDDGNLNIHIPVDAPAYVIYTSGTTGKPKGCVVSHRNMARLFSVSEEPFGFSADDVWTQFHSPAFDFSVWEIWGALLYGGRLVIVPYWLSRSPDDFHRLLKEQQVTVLNQTPSAFSQLVSVDLERPAGDLASLRHVIFGGEALDYSALRLWAERHPLADTRLINMYGITETTVHVTWHRISDSDLQRGRSIIGQPLADLQVHILDPHLQPVPVGVSGEMYISGPGVTAGYLNREALTAERFLANPFAGQLPDDIACHHRRMYRSGDLARRLANGDIEYLGRIDHQVKIRGHRIELGEIESALNHLPGIQESLVLARPDPQGNKRLLAWLLAKPGTTPDHADIRQQLRQLLPDYMLPAALITVSEWPLTANGKVDEKQLAEPDNNPGSQAYVAPRNDTELALCAIWSEVLGIEKIGIHDNFFELGGHSLLATRLAARIRSRLDCTLELRMIFEHPTIAELALAILEQALDALDIDEDDLQALLNELDEDS